MTKEQAFLAAADKHGVGHAGTTLWRYIHHGIQPGGFLTAVLANDLTKAVNRADEFNIVLIPNFVQLLYNHVPHTCWGSWRAVLKWPEFLAERQAEEIAACQTA